MRDFAQTRRTMVEHRGELESRINGIESDLQRFGACERLSADTDDIAGTVLHECLEEARLELGMVECAIRRVDSREYDCCIECGGRIDGDRLERLRYAVTCVECSRNFPLEYRQQLRLHHSNLRRSVHSTLGIVSDAIAKCQHGNASPQSLAPTLALLADLGRRMPEQFRTEEREGYLREALNAAPRFSRKATSLLLQHADFSRRIDSIVKEAETALDSPEAWARVREDFRQLALELLVHEQAENEILESAFLDDLGAAG
jgi:RNA polymerase-binding transcription factor DksA